ncbi:(2,3-dihydroxybenzoyl)adenylate synthase [Paenibacillus sp. Marseille-Q4541]|uniref:(2,3-dihydroxybenzoyl)adenylate synthase n=1 Tax=Paenibacillus sp. Marseille-Q4541 TaxID=2831522 RepID=UPI001BA74EC0|nr:(2,3-dihydroxybenzoyl)adenylate synthase [Paenibacillus sp. Marseille-Q4541]
MMEGCMPWPEEEVTRYKNLGYWQGITFSELLTERAKRYPLQAAIISGEKRWTYEDLHQEVEQLAAGLIHLGIQKEDRIVVQLPNIGELLVVIFALFRIGALPVFALPSHRQSEIFYISEYVVAKAYIIQDMYGGYDYRKMAAELQHAVSTIKHVFVVGEPLGFQSLRSLYADPASVTFSETQAGEVAFLQLSGGSTGLPKLIPRTHDDYIYSLHGSAEICGLSEKSVYMAVLPAAHNFPLSSPGVLGTLYAGGTVVMAEGGSPEEAFALIEKEKVTITALVPPLAMVWIDAKKSRKEDLSSLEVLQVGGAAFSEAAAIKLNNAFDCVLQQVFGMAEGLVNYTRLGDPEHVIVRTQGRPISPADEVRIVDEEDKDVEIGETGHLLTRGPYTIRGYYKAEEHNRRSFTPDGFYRTGDLARVTPEGNLIVTGRAKDQINRGGEKVAAEEVENHLLAHKELYDVAVVSMPDDFLGERICAFIIVREEQQKRPGIRELRRFLEKRGLAAYKIPDRFEFVSSFPMTAVGKVSKKGLRTQIADKLHLERNNQPIR